MTLGYTERESPFLSLAALHGGYFLRGQFCRFIGKEVGGTSAALIEKLLDRRHAMVLTGSHNTKVYHLAARPFYAALGQEDNRNRRSREPLGIQRRLMILDFVLDHLHYWFFATEQERVDYFTGVRGVPLAALPSKPYRSPSTGQVTTRYFVDKNPIFILDSDRSVNPLVHFCYVDEAVTRSGFETFLTQYRPLFEALGRFRLVHVAASKLPGIAAQRIFERFVGGIAGQSAGCGTEEFRRRLEMYFISRQRYETGQLEGFDRQALVQLREDRQRFSRAEYEALFDRWKQIGAAAFETIVPLAAPKNSPLEASFTTHILNHSYAIFGNLEEPTHGA